MKKVRILIGFFVAIPICLIVYLGQFLSHCMDEYKGWLIDIIAKREKKNNGQTI